MKLAAIIEGKKETDEFEDMTLSDSLELVIELLDAGDMSKREQDIISEMLDKLDDVMDIPDSEYEYEYEYDEDDEDDENDEDDEDLEETTTITQHADTEEKRVASFKKSSAGERIKNRIRQRRYRRRPEVKTRARRRAARQKTCGKNTTAQLTQAGGSSYVCKIKDRLRSKLMKRVSRIYG